MTIVQPETVPDGDTQQTGLIAHLSDALQRSEATLRAIGDIAPIGIFVNDVSGRPRYVSPAVSDLLDRSEKQAAECWQEAFHPDDRERLRAEWAECLRTGHLSRSRLRFVKRSGEVVFFDIVAAPVFDRHGHVSGVAGTIENIMPPERTAEAEHALRRSEQRYRQIIDTAREGVWLRDAEARTVFVNRRMCEMLGYTADEMLGRPVYDFMDADARAEAERRFALRKKGECQQHDVRYKHKDGSDVWAIVSASPVYDDDGVFIGGLGMITDITERKRHEETIQWQAYHDPLTGLPNRSLLEELLQQFLVLSGRQDFHVAVMYIDLDRFKQVNDTLGHDFGDRLLQVVAGRIAGCLRTEDTIARMGGDEFAALLPGIGHPEAVATVAQKLLEVLARPIVLAGQEVFIAGSIGVSLHPSDGNDVQSLLKHADVAMYQAKEQGGNGYCLFSQSMSTDGLEHLTLESSLRRALSRDEFHLLYQPQVSLETGEVRAVETLCRWQHPELGLVQPAQFIPLAEAAGLIVPIGEWVLRAACRQAAAWRDAGHPMRVCVNISARQFVHPGTPDLVRSVLAETGLDAQWLELELTESALMKSARSAVDVLGELRSLGVRLSLDDFGTGYSSLSYLREFRFDVLKIDRSFIANIVGDKVNQALVRAILELSHALKLEVVAEGVECDDQRRVLQALGCPIIQGYLFSPPVLPENVPLLQP
jgi:diguanylate cyclase (GGDEF)-like protein/PAS domain S-box-containing protein